MIHRVWILVGGQECDGLVHDALVIPRSPKWGRTTFSHIDSIVYRDFGGKKGPYRRFLAPKRASKRLSWPCEVSSFRPQRAFLARKIPSKGSFRGQNQLNALILFEKSWSDPRFTPPRKLPLQHPHPAAAFHVPR